MIRKNKFEKINELLSRLEGLVEIIGCAFMYMYVWKYFYRTEGSHAFFGRGKWVIAAIYIFLLIVMFAFLEGFRYGYLKLSDVVISQWISFFVVNLVSYFQLCLIGATLQLVVPFLVLTAAEFLVSLICCFIFSKIYHRFSSAKKLVMVYGTDKAINLKLKMDGHGDRYKVEKVIKHEEGYENICKEIINYDAVILNDIPAEIRNDILKFCYGNGIYTYVVPKVSDIIVKSAETISLYDTPLFLVNGSGITVAQRFAKRLTDIVISTILMIPCGLIMLVTALAIKIGDGGPVFFKQDRVTMNGKVFEILKFRSMIVDADKIETPHMAESDDPRITKVGRVIRKFRIDELPQLINILKGDMSLVGPRPERCEHVAKYTAEIPEFIFRQSVKAGLTGYAQVYGKYNTTAYDKLRLDLIYIGNYSYILDLKLLFFTIQTMFHPESTEGADVSAQLDRRGKELIKEMEKEPQDQ